MDLETISDILENILFMDRNVIPYAGNFGINITSILQQNYDKILINKLKFNIQNNLNVLIPTATLLKIGIIVNDQSKIQLNLSIKVIDSTTNIYDLNYTL